MLTRCPSCQTAFRVRDEQLQARGGRVRCGHCHTPFDAVACEVYEGRQEPTETDPPAHDELSFWMPGEPEDLAPPLAEAPTPSVIRRAPRSNISEAPSGGETAADEQDIAEPLEDLPPTSPEAEVADLAPTPPQVPVEEVLETAEAEDAPVEAIQPPIEAPAAQPLTLAEELSDTQALDLTTSALTLEFVIPDDAPEASSNVPTAPSHTILGSGDVPIWLQPAATDTPSDTPPEPAEEPSVMPVEPTNDGTTEIPLTAKPSPIQALRTSPSPQTTNEEAIAEGPPPAWQVEAPARKSSGFLSALNFILLLALAFQGAYFFREPLSIAFPEARPWYVQACAELGCTMPLPRQAAAITIVSSDLIPRNAERNRFELDGIVRNLAAHTQAYPYLELSLTDAGNQLLGRRVFAPEEWVQSGPVAEGLAGGTESTTRLRIDTGDLRPLGYRLYAFYP